jgi:hypothetical protein
LAIPVTDPNDAPETTAQHLAVQEYWFAKRKKIDKFTNKPGDKDETIGLRLSNVTRRLVRKGKKGRRVVAVAFVIYEWQHEQRQR